MLVRSRLDQILQRGEFLQTLIRYWGESQTEFAKVLECREFGQPLIRHFGVAKIEFAKVFKRSEVPESRVRHIRVVEVEFREVLEGHEFLESRVRNAGMREDESAKFLEEAKSFNPSSFTLVSYKSRVVRPSSLTRYFIPAGHPCIPEVEFREFFQRGASSSIPHL